MTLGAQGDASGGGQSLTGICLCGNVSVTLLDPQRHVEICHCAMCRRWGGGFYAALSGTDTSEDGAKITGENSITAYQSSDWAERAFCKNCGSHLWFRFLPTDGRSFHAGLFALADDLTIEKEIFTDRQARWSDMSGDHPRQTGEEVLAEAKAAGFFPD